MKNFSLGVLTLAAWLGVVWGWSYLAGHYDTRADWWFIPAVITMVALALVPTAIFIKQEGM